MTKAKDVVIDKSKLSGVHGVNANAAHFEKYKISFISFIKPGVLPFTLTLLFIILFTPLMVYTYGTEKWLVALIWISFTAIPPMLLHVNYFFHDRRKSIEINNPKGLLILTERNNKQSLKYEEIERIEKYHSKSLKDKAISKIHWHTYYYYKIIVKDKNPITISRMVIEKFENEIKGISFKFIRVPYPIIRKSEI
jgi:heme/copper-type cytochrome/quinol oxidase subunit 4